MFFLSDILTFYLFIILIGVVSGFIAGLLGIGGGAIIIPALFFLYSTTNFQHPEYLSQFVFGTTNGVIFIQSVKNFYDYYKKGLFSFKNTLKFVFIGFLGGFCGSKVASIIDSASLKTYFGILLIFVSIQMFMPLSKNRSSLDSFSLEDMKSKFVSLVFVALFTGFFSGFFGIGGGIIAIPLLTTFFNFPMMFAQGFSVSMIPFNQIGGMTGYGMCGLKLVGFNPPFVGFIDVSVVLICGAMGFFTSKFGLNTAIRLNQKILKKIFAGFLMIVALKFIC